jgi:hypothetical protein
MPVKKQKRNVPPRLKAYLSVQAYGWRAIQEYAAARGLDLREGTTRGVLSAAMQRALVLHDWRVDKMVAIFWRLARREWHRPSSSFKSGWRDETMREVMERGFSQIYATVAREAQRRWGDDFGGRPILMAALYEFLNLTRRERAKLCWATQDRQDAQRRADAEAVRVLQTIYR